MLWSGVRPCLSSSIIATCCQLSSIKAQTLSVTKSCSGQARRSNVDRCKYYQLLSSTDDRSVYHTEGAPVLSCLRWSMHSLQLQDFSLKPTNLGYMLFSQRQNNVVSSILISLFLSSSIEQI